MRTSAAAAMRTSRAFPCHAQSIFDGQAGCANFEYICHVR